MMTNVLLFIGLFLLVALLVWNVLTEYRLKHFFKGSNGKTLENSIKMTLLKVEEVKSENEELKNNIQILESKLKKTIRNIETVRFNPFPDQGGNQSFATALINDEGNGVIISSLYSRERVSVFAKPIKNRKTEYELTEEEKAVLEKTV